MTYDAPFYGSLWLHSSKWHSLLYDTLHVCDYASLFMDQLLTVTLCFDHFSNHLVTCVFQNIPFSTFLRIVVEFIQKTYGSSLYICHGDVFFSEYTIFHFLEDCSAVHAEEICFIEQNFHNNGFIPVPNFQEGTLTLM